MAACKSVLVLCPNARRQTVKVGPTTTILQILEEVCKKQGLSSQEYAIKHQKKVLDETLPIRYSGLCNNAHLEIVLHTKTTRKDVQCTIALQLLSGERLLKDFTPDTSLWDVIIHWNSQENSPHHHKLLGEEGQQVVCVYMTQRISGEQTLKKTSLYSLGLSGKRAIIRLLHEASNKPSEPVIAKQEKSSDHIEIVPGSSLQPCTESIPETNNDTSSSNHPSMQKQDDYKEQPSNINPPVEDRHRQLNSKNVSPDRAAREPKRTRVAGPDPLFPDFKFPDRPPVEITKPQAPVVTEERLHFLATPCERCPVVFKEDDETLTAKEQDLPDSFYDVTVEDLRKMLQGLQSERLKSEDMPLLTKAMRESRRLEEICKYDRVVIRVKFPDRFALQGFFRPQEKVSALMEFVKSHLEHQDLSFYLYTTPPKIVLTNKDNTLYDVHLCPASLVYFGCEQKRDYFLANNLLGNITTALDAEKVVIESGIHSATRAHTVHDNTQPEVKTIISNDTADQNVSNHTSHTVPNPGGSSSKVPKWFKGSGK